MDISVVDGEIAVPGGWLRVVRAEQDQDLPQILFGRAPGCEAAAGSDTADVCCAFNQTSPAARPAIRNTEAAGRIISPDYHTGDLAKSLTLARKHSTFSQDGDAHKAQADQHRGAGFGRVRGGSGERAVR